MWSWYYVISVFISFIYIANAQRTTDKMFSNIAGATCFRRLNATHSTGCSSKFSGSIGVLHVVKSTEDIDFLINIPPSPPYAAVLSPNLFTRENILRLKNEASEYVSIIVLINNTTNLGSFSHESKCPNQFGGLIKKQTCDVSKPETTWNPFGTGLLHEDFSIPIYYVADTMEITKILNCFEKFNNHDFENHHYRSLCSIQVKSFMAAAVSSEVCIRRNNIFHNINPAHYCDPLQGKNVYATLFPREIVNTTSRSTKTNEDIFLVTARMDTTSFFDGVGLGAMGSLVPFATLITTAQLLRKLLPERNVNSNDINILFVLFNGESYDYIGSQRLVYDMKKSKFPSVFQNTNPINMENIKFMLDLGTLDNLNEVQIFHATEFIQATKFAELMTKYSQNYKLNITVTNSLSENLPPTSAHSFLRENITFPAVILNSKPKNKYYHSIYDDMENINYNYRNTSENFLNLDQLDKESDHFNANDIQLSIRNMASIIGFSLYELSTGQEYNEQEGASSVLVDEFLYCFLFSATCPLLKASQVEKGLPLSSHAPPRYISIHQSYTHNSTVWTYDLIGFLLGQKIATIPKENCTVLPLIWYDGVNGTGECHLTTQNFSYAYSPAFFETDYNWKSGKYSTWTESRWETLSARIFLRPSTSHEALTLAIGIVVLIISFVLVFLINSKSDVLFGNCASSEIITIPANC